MAFLTLKPCPFCGERAYIAEISPEKMADKYLLFGEENASVKMWYGVVCAGCASEGKYSDTVVSAAKCWNTRCENKNNIVVESETETVEFSGVKYTLTYVRDEDQESGPRD